VKTSDVKPAESCTPTPGIYEQKMGDCLPYNLRPIPGIAWQGGYSGLTDPSEPGKPFWGNGKKTKVKQSGQD
jgi:hypothetical protein